MKETQRKEKEDGALPDKSVDLLPGPSLTPSPLRCSAVECSKGEAQASAPVMSETGKDLETDMLAALCQVTGKDAGLLRPSKRQEYEQAAARLAERGFAAADVRDFALYWREAHPIGSRKPDAGYPHLVQVLEDLPGALPWIHEHRQRQVEEAWQEEATCLPPVQPLSPEVDAEVRSLWKRIRDELALRLPSPPVAADLQRAKPLSLSDGTLLIELPSARLAEWWQVRLERPVTEAVLRVVEHPLTVAFTGPQPN